MPENELNLILSLKDKATSKLDKFNKTVNISAASLGKLAIAGAAVAVGIGTVAVKAAVDFEKSMANVATLVDTNVESMDDMGKAVMNMSKRIPVDMAELTSALYQVRSAGIGASDAMGVLESSGRLAVAGLGTTTEATDLLTSAFNVFASQGYSADEIANILFKTVKAGKTTVSELAQSFGMVAPIAGELNIKFSELQAATAALTTMGLKASVAQSQLRAAMVALLKPTADMDKLYEKMGVESGRQLLETSGGMVEAFIRIKEAAEGNDAALAKALGSVEALNAVFALTSGKVGQAFADTLTGMKDGVDSLTEAVDKKNAATAAMAQLLKNELNVAMTDLGVKILPSLISSVRWLTQYLKDMVNGWTELQSIIQSVRDTFDSWVTKGYKQLLLFGEGLDILIGRFKNLFSVQGLGGSIGGMLGFAKGGVVPGPIGAPMPAIVHGGETIIPAGKSGGISITITGNSFMGDEDSAERIGDMIIKKLKMQSRLVL